MPRGLRLLGFCALALSLPVLAGCGDTPTIPQVQAATPFAAGTVAIRQLGNAPARIDTSSVTFKQDASRAIVVELDARSTSSSAVTVTIRGSLYDAKGNLIGDVTGGQVGVGPGSSAHVRLTGPTPLGTIASVTFEASVVPLPT